MNYEVKEQNSYYEFSTDVDGERITLDVYISYDLISYGIDMSGQEGIYPTGNIAKDKAALKLAIKAINFINGMLYAD